MQASAGRGGGRVGNSGYARPLRREFWRDIRGTGDTMNLIRPRHVPRYQRTPAGHSKIDRNEESPVSNGQ
eukprot:325261-Amorphochlora_amoeboformis.AAC.2